MKTTTVMNVHTAATQLLDALTHGTKVTLDVPFADFASGTLDPLMSALHSEARRRGLGVMIEPIEENRLCLSLRHR